MENFLSINNVRFHRYSYGGYFEMVGIIIGSLISLAFAFLLGTIAEKRGAKVMFWAIMGAVFGPLAIPFVFFAKTDIEKSKNS